MFKTPYSEELWLEIWKVIEKQIKIGIDDIWKGVETEHGTMDIQFSSAEEGDGHDYAILYDTERREGEKYITTLTGEHIILYKSGGLPEIEREKLKEWIKK